MYVWLEVVGRHEKRMQRLPRLHQIALSVCCADGAFSRTREYFAESVPRKSLATVRDALEALWEFLQASQSKKATFAMKRLQALYAINPGEDDPMLAAGWGQLLDGVISTCDMARGEDPKDSILDAVGYAYQAVEEMAIVRESSRPITTEKPLREFEKKSPTCQAEMRFQLERLEILEAGTPVESAVFPGVRFPAK